MGLSRNSMSGGRSRRGSRRVKYKKGYRTRVRHRSGRGRRSHRRRTHRRRVKRLLFQFAIFVHSNSATSGQCYQI